MQTPPKNKHIQYIIGIDEVGRGPIAGPVTVCAFLIRAELMRGLRGQIAYLTDSKKLSAKKREHAYADLCALVVRESQNYGYALASVSAKQIDSRGISWALQNTISSVLKKLEKKAGCTGEHAYVLLDGGLYAPKSYPHQKTIIKGDTSQAVISAASIIAKVTRDRVMVRYGQKNAEYAPYDFQKNKGYGTRAHYVAIKKHGLSLLHRKTWIHKD